MPTKRQCEICSSTLYCFKRKCGRLLCSRHQKQIKVYGKIFERTRNDKNEIVNRGEYSDIFLYDRKGNVKCFGKIDNSDVEKVRDFKWHVLRNNASVPEGSGYIKNSRLNTTLHIFLLGKKKGFVIDHINGDRLDNRRSNLRFITKSENCLNQRRQHGVHLYKPNNKWVAHISINKKKKTIGYFNTYEEALSARLKYQNKYFYGIQGERLSK